MIGGDDHIKYWVRKNLNKAKDPKDTVFSAEWVKDQRYFINLSILIPKHTNYMATNA